MKSMKRAASVALCLLLALSPAPAAAAAENAEETAAVSLDNIYELAYENNSNIEIADLNLKAFYDGIEQMEDALDAAWNMSKLPDIYGFYGSQMLSQLMSQQVSSYEKQSVELSAESAKKQIALGGQSMLVAYYGLLAQKDGLEAAREKLGRGIASAKASLSLGLATEDGVNGLERAAEQMDASLQQLSDAAETLKSKLALYIGADESAMEIAPFAGISGEEAKAAIDAIDTGADYALAEKNCYLLKIQALAVSDARGTQRDIEKVTLSAMKSEFPTAFHTAYLTLKEKAAALSNAESTCAADERDLEIASLKLSLGLISRNAHADTETQCATDQSALTLAQLDFISARNTYRAMVDGIWQRNPQE